MRVSLTSDEIFLAATAGVIRRLRGISGKLDKNQHGLPDNAPRWENDIEGALAESALAKALGQYWRGAGPLDERHHPDVADFDVRATKYENGHLIIHPDDANKRRFYLVTGSDGEYRIAGWCYGEEGKRERWWRDPTGKGRPAFFVPQSELREFNGK